MAKRNVLCHFLGQIKLLNRRVSLWKCSRGSWFMQFKKLRNDKEKRDGVYDLNPVRIIEKGRITVTELGLSDEAMEALVKLYFSGKHVGFEKPCDREQFEKNMFSLEKEIWDKIKGDKDGSEEERGDQEGNDGEQEGNDGEDDS